MGGFPQQTSCGKKHCFRHNAKSLLKALVTGHVITRHCRCGVFVVAKNIFSNNIFRCQKAIFL